MFTRIDYMTRPTISDLVDVMNRHKELECVSVTQSVYNRLSKTFVNRCKVNNIEIIIRGDLNARAYDT